MPNNTNKIQIVKEPFVRLAKRDNAGILFRTLIRFLAVAVSFLFILIFLSGVSGFSFSELVKYLNLGSFETNLTVSSWIKDSMLLLGISVALAPVFKMKFWNIGAQGQVLMGALATATIMIKIGDQLNNTLLIIIMFFAALFIGGFWSVITAVFKVKINANETLFTLMMNYIAIQFVAASCDIWQGNNPGMTINMLSKKGYLPELFGNTYGFVYITVAIIALLMYIYMKHTKHGYEISVVGESLNTAKYAGINTGKVYLRTVFLSGAICGIMGFLYVAGVDHNIAVSTSGGYGFTAIIVAWTAKFNPFVMAIISFIIVFLQNGSGSIINYAKNMNSFAAYIIVGIFLFFLIGCEFFINYRLVFNSKIQAFNKACKNRCIKKFPKTIKFFSLVNSTTKLFYEKVTKIPSRIKNRFIKKSNSHVEEESK